MIPQLITSAADQGVYLYVKDGVLHFDLAAESFPPVLKQQILAAKPEIIAFLTQAAAAQTPKRPPLHKGWYPDGCPLSFSQQRFWLAQQMQPDDSRYHMPIAFRLQGAVDLGLLQQVFDLIVQRHEILRTGYLENSGEVRQYVRAPAGFRLDVQDLRRYEPSLQDTVLQGELREAMMQPFDLRHDLMLRASYFQLSADAASGQPQGVLLLVLHHIAFDGWSVDVLTREFVALYQAGQADPLPVLPVQYADFAQWQQGQGALFAGQLQYWQQQLQDCPVTHGLQLQYDRPALKQTQGSVVRAFLPARTAKALSALAAACQLSDFMLLHSAVALVLTRHANSTDLVIGTAVANRTEPQLASLLGCFVNTLALRVNTGHATVADYLAHVREVHQQAQSHQDLPFELLVEQLDVARSSAYSPLFQIMLSSSDSFADAGASLCQLDGLSLSRLSHDDVVVKFDLEIDVALNSEGVSVTWSYDTALFARGYIELLNDHLCNLLQAMTARLPQQTLPLALNQLSILGADLEQYLTDTVHSSLAYLQQLCIQQRFEQWAAQTPEAVALVFGELRLSYRQLNERANQLAHYLRAHANHNAGVAPDQLIGLCVERGLEMVIATLAILKAGAAYVPLDPAYPPARLAHMLSDAALQTVLCSAAAGPLLQQLQPGLQLVPVDGLGQSAAAYAGYASTNPQVPGLHSGHLAYAIYTSGSTGTPKGVLLQHQGLLNLQMNSEQLLGVNQHSRVLHFASMSFDAGSWELMMALLGGGTLVIADSQTRLSPEAVSELLYRERISHALLPPALLAMMPYRDDLALQALIVGGEACEQDLAARWNSRYRFFNAYGPTEASVVATLTQVLPGQQVTIGRPLHNVSALILDSRQALLPVGVAGELYLSGVGLARGYLGQPALSAERFIANPYAQAGQPALSERLYRTGDLVRYQADGQIEYLGRLDEQVKIRGFRVELSEIEQQLLQCPGVSAALVLLNDTTRQLVAYLLCPADAEPPSAATLRQRLSAALPDYMVPVSYIVLPRWPLTPNGKIDKKALPAPAVAEVPDDYVAPVSALETALVRIWAGLLNTAPERISCRANFFAIGGHSLLVSKMAQAIVADDRLGIKQIQMQDIFTSQTLADLATRLELLQLAQRNQQMNIRSNDQDLVEDGEI